MSFYQWSVTAADNATAAPDINWAEGMSPSSVNDSARAMMADTAGWRDDISGTLVTTGSGAAYSITTNQGFDTHGHLIGAMLTFVPHTTNTGAVTLTVDGFNAPIRMQTGTSGNLSAGTLIAGTPYTVTYFEAPGVSEFLLHNFFGSPNVVPVGGLLFYTYGGGVPNSNFVFPIGQAISRTVYSTYFGLVATYYGPGNGTTTFNVPDLRSRMLLPWATMGGGADPGLVTTAGSGIDGATIGAVGGAQNVTLNTTQIPSITPAFTGSALGTHGHTIPASAQSVFVGGSGAVPDPNIIRAGGSLATSNDSAGTPAGSIAAFGGGQSHNNMPPVMVMPLILRVL